MFLGVSWRVHRSCAPTSLWECVMTEQDMTVDKPRGVSFQQTKS